MRFALYFKVIPKHMNSISFVQDDLENQLHPFTCTTEAHILGILDSQHQLLNITTSLAFPCKHTFKNQGESQWAQKMVYICCTQRSFFRSREPSLTLRRHLLFLILQDRFTWKGKNVKHQSLYSLGCFKFKIV